MCPSAPRKKRKLKFSFVYVCIKTVSVIGCVQKWYKSRGALCDRLRPTVDRVDKKLMKMWIK